MMRAIQLAVACTAMFAGQAAFKLQAAMIVVDLSPETTGAAPAGINFNNQFGQGIIGDRFTVSADTTLTGGSIFLDLFTGSVGNPVKFMVFADNSGTPSLTPLVDINTTIDSVDTMFTGSEGLYRKHATIAPTFLAAGNYWFSMPANDPSFLFTAKITTPETAFDDGFFRTGSTNLITEFNGLQSGDMFFQLEGSSVSSAVPEPSSLALFGIGAIGLAFVAVRRRRGKTVSAA